MGNQEPSEEMTELKEVLSTLQKGSLSKKAVVGSGAGIAGIFLSVIVMFGNMQNSQLEAQNDKLSAMSTSMQDLRIELTTLGARMDRVTSLEDRLDRLQSAYESHSNISAHPVMEDRFHRLEQRLLALENNE